MNKSLLLNNLLLAVIWVIATGVATAENFIFGFIIGLGILWITATKKSDRKYFVILPKLVYFFLFLVWKLILSNISTVKESLYSKSKLEPGIVKVPLTLKDEFHIVTLANLVSLTPGTMVMDISDDMKVMYVHVMHLEDKDKFIRELKEDFENKLIELFA
ncbi:Na+/H+ antiporter subunit E [Mariniradius sediminis]|uniref:Na+/H+ antiporter subunit E n=1 Tax=Mariniradius sediminis TaxID=2909237 RepID=A0ABS9BVQ6_9BACT|nr:Na+/H+ antiporter subunit E [Mariniradius sediminis]MCF1751665.1 Na+/H+ antiporter subunit E [Mariniradius sediminis]